MRFKVLKLSASKRLLLEPGGNTPFRKGILLYFKGKRVGILDEAIASVEDPLFLARPLMEGSSLVGKILESR